MAFDPAVRQGAHQRLASMGKGDNGQPGEMPMMQEPQGTPEGPRAELDALLGMIDPAIAAQISALVDELAGGPAEESLEPEMPAMPPMAG